MRQWVSGNPGTSQPGTSQSGRGPLWFSQQKHRGGKTQPRNYQRMNQKKMEEQAQLHWSAGSLWVMEGQGAYLFAQNTGRQLGDLLKVHIEGVIGDQLATKASMIQDVLEKREAARRSPPGPGGGSPQKTTTQKAEAQINKTQKKKSSKDQAFQIKVVPTRIIEILRDGNYRVQGSQPLMIHKGEYQVMVLGTVRPDDFDEAGIQAEKLLNPQFDIVRRGKPGVAR